MLHLNNDLSESDLQIIASMHICARKIDKPIKEPAYLFRFFLDKVKHFYSFDKNSIIIERDVNNLISGILIYTYSEKKFNSFSGPRHLRFYIRSIKAIFGYYGYNFKKFLLAAKSMLGLNQPKSNVVGSDDFAKIWVLIVAEEERKKGIATRLLQRCLQQAQERNLNTIRVTVKTDNIPAIKTYEKAGFKIIGSCIESSGNSYIMEKIITLHQ